VTKHGEYSQAARRASEAARLLIKQARESLRRAAKERKT
jgi:hypothetical protein